MTPLFALHHCRHESIPPLSCRWLAYLGKKQCTAWLCMSMSVHQQRASFRYTLGGFYLARYSDSPVGAFDEV